MLRQRAKIGAFLLYIFDLVLLGAAFFVAYGTRDAIFSTDYGPLYPLEYYLPWMWLILAISSCLFYFFKLYESYRIRPILAEPVAIFKALFWETLFLGSIIFAFKFQEVSRLFIFLFVATAFLLLSSARTVVRITARYIRGRGLNFRNILIVGAGRQATEIADAILQYKDWGMRVYGVILDTEENDNQVAGTYAVKGNIEDIPFIITNEIIDEVIFAVSQKRIEELESVFLMCEEQGVRTRVAMSIFPHLIAKPHIEDFGGIPLLTFSTTPENELLLAVKRAFDVVVSFTLLITLTPLFVFLSIVIKLTSPGPVFFRQERVGMNGRLFTLYKFRSMLTNAEAMKKDLMHLNEMGGPVFKISNDPRVTPIGRLIRKYSVDELPQLINVLKGDMSVVGPRPPVPEEVAQYERWQRRRLSMKPGLTCLWQIQGRSRIIDFEKWMRLDLQYIDNWSLKLDLKIFLKTVPTVFLGRGAS
jgi:exopolysaccharide biosynthesis polyprenyl glycosylphosphotransferase